ncbi:protein KAKU4-like [Zingiber officinale]|uniref:protein KAKU4-like n=1 Tax=Zingiber officinale TaxID=94328 RepID=UPI001C4CB73E|nr:protein KAKU4-like [Zingiber officinale]
MSSLFGHRRRPEETPPPPPSPHAAPPGNAGGGWLANIVYGAGKLVSSVFGSDSASSSSYCCSLEEETDGNSNEDENVSLDLRQSEQLNEKLKTSYLVNDSMEGSIVILKEVGSKAAIEQLLLQETFTRDECNKLIKTIESRVVDDHSAEVDPHHLPKDMSDMVVSKDIAYPQSYQLSHPAGDLPKSTYSVLKSLSPTSCTCQADDMFPDSAIRKVNRWLESKRSSSSSKTAFDHGPSTLHTDMLQSDLEGLCPVDVAKSYMRSLPACQLENIDTSMYKTAPSRGMSLCNDRTNSISYHPSPSSKKRSYHTSTTGKNVDHRRVRAKSTYNLLSGPCSTLPEALALHTTDENATVAVRQSNERTNEHVKILPVNNNSDMDMASETILTHTSKPSLEPTDPRVGGGSFCFDPINDMPDDKQGIRETLMATQHLSIMGSSEVEKDGNSKQYVLYSERPATAVEVIKSEKGPVLALPRFPFARLKKRPSSKTAIKEEPQTSSDTATAAAATNSFHPPIGSPDRQSHRRLKLKVAARLKRGRTLEN